MGAKKGKAPKPDYQAMANRFAQWQYEDAEWYRISMDEAKNIHNRELGRAKARYAASGGSKDKIAEIEAEHKRKLADTEADIGERYKKKQATLRSGPTYEQLFGRFSAIQNRKLTQEYESLKRMDEFTRRKTNAPTAEQYLKNVGGRLTKVGTFFENEHQTTTEPEYNIAYTGGAEAVSEEAFVNWARTYGNWREPAQEEAEMEQIKTRQGERPRKPIMGNIPTEQNPWI